MLNIQNGLEKLYETYPVLIDIFNQIKKQGATAYLVGGAVRDLLLQKPIKDIDIEVHGMQPEDLKHLLQKFGQVDIVGTSFGVYKLFGLPIDWSLPRKDSSGRKPEVMIDPHMSLEDAFARRDVTINAMGIDLHTGELIDPFGGLHDLQKGILRSPVLSFFEQDPLRFFRIMQFIARFNMQPDASLQALLEHMDISKVSIERIEQEFHKMLLRSSRPSLGIRWLKQSGRLKEILPELAHTVGVIQDKQWHPEGDVFEHTMQTLDAAARLDYADAYQRLVGLYAALCHDLGKAITTKKEGQQVISYDHAKQGEPLARRMLKRISKSKKLIDDVCTLVRWHLIPLELVKQKASLSAYKRLARKISPDLTLEQLAKLALADRQGRNPAGNLPLDVAIPEVDEFVKKAKQAGVTHKAEPPILQGRDFLDILEPGPLLGKVVKRAYALQMAGIVDPKQLKKQALADVIDKHKVSK